MIKLSEIVNPFMYNVKNRSIENTVYLYGVLIWVVIKIND